MLAISQNPERVSNILRSSTETTVDREMGANAGRSTARSVRRSVEFSTGVTTGVMAVMPLLLLVGSRR